MGVEICRLVTLAAPLESGIEDSGSDNGAVK